MISAGDTIALIGTGLMGTAMAGRLLGAGFRVRGWDRDAARLAASGAEAAGNAAEAMRIGAGEEQQISRIRRQGRTKQCCHQGVGFGEIKVEPIARVELQLRHGGEALLDGEHGTADALEAAFGVGGLDVVDLPARLAQRGS